MRPSSGVAALAPRTLLSAILAGALATSSLAAPAPAPGVEVGTATVALGEAVPVTLSIALPAGEAPRFPSWHTHWGDATILEVGAVEQRSEAGLEVYRQQLRLAAYRPGTVLLPPVAVRWGVEALLSTEARFEVVFSLSPEELAAGPQPAAPPRRLPPPSPWWSAALAAAALLAAGAVGRRGTRSSPAPATDAASELLAGLAELEGQQPDPILFHSLLSRGVRRFLGRSLGFEGERSTTAQIARRLREPGLPRAWRRSEELLEQCDAVRFGGRPAQRREMGRRLATARALARAVPAAGTPEARP